MARQITVLQQYLGHVTFVILLLCPSGKSAVGLCQKQCDCTSAPLEVDSSELVGRCTCPEYGTFPENMLQDIVQLNIDFSQPVVLRMGNIQKFHRIWFLTISGMQFVEPGGFQGLETLDKLVLSNNYMRVLGTNMFTDLQHLTKLVAEGTTENKIHALENGTFCNLTSLKRLDLKANAIRDLIPEHFRDLENLDIFDFSRNRLNQIRADTFVNSPLLTEIKLSGNQITEIHRNAFIGLVKLNKLELDGNRIMGMQQPRFLLGSLQLPTDTKFRRVAISLDENPLRCDCHLNWVSSWLDNSQICNGFCDSPSQFKHRPLQAVYKNELPQCLPNNTVRYVEPGNQLELTCSFASASWVTHDGRNLQEHGDCEDPFYLTNRDSLVIWKTSPELSGTYACFSSDGTQSLFYQVNVTESTSGTTFTILEWTGIVGVPSAFVLGILVMYIIVLLKNKYQRRSHGNDQLPVAVVDKGDHERLIEPGQREADSIQEDNSRNFIDYINIFRKNELHNSKNKTNISISI